MNASRATRAALVTAALTAALAAPAGAHVKAREPEAPAGSRYTFSFEIDHGCGSSPTTGLRILMPSGAFEVKPVEKPGWTASVAGEPSVVEFAGGRVPDQTKDTFSVELVTPNRPGEVILFPTVQRCEVGESPWIDELATSNTPAPRITLTANATPLTAPPATTTTAAAPATTTTTTTTTTTAAASGAQTAAGDDGDDGGSTIVPLAIATVLSMVAGGGLAWSRSRGQRSPRAGNSSS